jgi:predicted transcriptional regulator of viral defense system
MKCRNILFELLKTQPYFNKKALYQLGEQYGLKKTTVDTCISRSLKRKEIILLKNGLYISSHFNNQHKGDISYLFLLANILRAPSYISLWTALQYYDLTTESIHIITSVTPKVTRSYTTKVGNFVYRSIQKNLFSDFSLIKINFNFFIASPSKALFDLLYFNTNQFRGLQMNDINTKIEELRIDIDEMESEEQKKFFRMIHNFKHHE